jgi:hypothetical protein
VDLDLRGEFLIGSTWVDATGNILKRQSLTHSRGRLDLGARVDPSTCRPLLNNTNGQFSPDNPTSPYYGAFGRNTPFRVSIRAGTPALDVPGAVGDHASTPDHSSLDITGDIDIRLDATLLNWVDAVGGASIDTVEIIGKMNFAAGERSWVLGTRSDRLYFEWSSDGSNGPSASSTVPLLITPSGRMSIRVTLDVDNGAGGRTATFYTAPSGTAGPWTQLGDPVVQSGTTAIFSSLADIKIGDATNVSFTRARGRIHKAEIRSGINGTVVANPNFSAQAVGTTSFVDGSGRTWTMNGATSITDRRTRLSQELTAYPTEWHPSGAHAWVDATTAGILRRLRRGSHALDSTLRRRIPSGQPLAYWPMEDGRDSTQFYSPIPGVRPMNTRGMDLASDDTLAGSNALPTVRGGSTMAGTVPPPSGNPTEWHTEFIYFLPNNGPATARVVMNWFSTGTVRLWQFKLKTNGAEIYGYDADEAVVTSAILDLTGLPVFNAWTRWQLYAVQSGSNVNWTVRWVSVGVSSAVWSASYAGTVGRITGVSGTTGGYSADLEGMRLGHIAAFSTANTAIYNSADIGFAGETAGGRMQRLSGEEGLPLTVCGNVATQALVGPQRPSGVLDLLEEAADADGGILYEDREQAALRFRPRDSMYNQRPALVLDYGGPGLAPPLRPTGDDDATQNDVTVTRTGGSSARAVLEAGPLSIQAPPNGVGIGYDTAVERNLFVDEQTGPHAFWMLHLGTYEGRRYPQVRVLVHKAPPELLDQLLAIDVGDKLVIRNPPIWVAPGDIELIVQGYEETWASEFTWEIVFNCTPGRPWSVAGRAVVEGFEDTSYELSITNGGTLPWTRSTAHFNSGTWSLRSGAISNNQTSDAIVAIPPGSTELRFWYWTSSEASGPGFDGDRLLVLVDGVQVLRAQGTTPWTQAIVDVTDKSQVIFRYQKDNSTSSGEDAVYIDDLSFTGLAPVRRDTAGSQLAAGVSATATSLSVATTLGPLWTTDPVHFPFNAQLGGEVVRVTSITGATSPQTFTVVRSVNGVVKPQTASTPVSLANPAIRAL